MAAANKVLKAVKPQPGRPLYATVRDVLRDAIDRGVFIPGQQMPSTKDLSEQLAVSLVTAHRALQELVTAGVLQRAQGRGTFVHEKYPERKSQIAEFRVGLVFHADASLADFYHGQILEGVHKAAHEMGADLLLLRFGEDVRNECNGYLLVNPFPEEAEAFSTAPRRGPALVVGARCEFDDLTCFDIDNADLAGQAVRHLFDRGHRAIAYVGGATQLSNSRDRWQGFLDACRAVGLARTDHALVQAKGWRLDEDERAQLVAALRASDRPTAIFAAGYAFALEVYGAAREAGLNVPKDLAVVGVDDPPSAEHLTPSMTTMRQPLMQLGREAMTAVMHSAQESAGQGNETLTSRKFQAELVVRESSAGPAGGIPAAS
jgi:DNA-binding LacI/PurR family transcriptional regulator